MTDPLEEVLAAEAEARRRIEAAREALEENLRAARVDASRIRAQNEQRTRRAVEHAEKHCVAETMLAIDRLDTEISRQLEFDHEAIDERLEKLVRERIDRFWPR